MKTEQIHTALGQKIAILWDKIKNVKLLHFSVLQPCHPDLTLTDNQFSSTFYDLSIYCVINLGLFRHVKCLENYQPRLTLTNK